MLFLQSMSRRTITSYTFETDFLEAMVYARILIVLDQQTRYVHTYVRDLSIN